MPPLLARSLAQSRRSVKAWWLQRTRIKPPVRTCLTALGAPQGEARRRAQRVLGNAAKQLHCPQTLEGQTEAGTDGAAAWLGCRSVINPLTVVTTGCQKSPERDGKGNRQEHQSPSARDSGPPNPVGHTHLTGEEIEAQELE